MFEMFRWMGQFRSRQLCDLLELVELFRVGSGGGDGGDGGCSNSGGGGGGDGSDGSDGSNSGGGDGGCSNSAGGGGGDGGFGGDDGDDDEFVLLLFIDVLRGLEKQSSLLLQLFLLPMLVVVLAAIVPSEGDDFVFWSSDSLVRIGVSGRLSFAFPFAAFVLVLLSDDGLPSFVELISILLSLVPSATGCRVSFLHNSTIDGDVISTCETGSV